MPAETVAVIPARGGSKRCPDKNVAMFRGRPLTAHTIEQAKEAGIFDRIIVSSDDPRVIDVALQYDVEIDNREGSISGDNDPLIKVLGHIIRKYGVSGESLMGLLLVTAPLREVNDIVSAFEMFLASDHRNSVVSVTTNEYPVEMTWRIQKGHLEHYLTDCEVKTTRKQDFEQTYRYNDAVIFDLAKNFMDSGRNLFGKSPIPYVMPRGRSICIDYEFDLKLVQLIGEHW